MQEVNLFELFSAPLTRTGISYFITGSVAAMLYGDPRLTHDIDIVVELSSIKDIQLLPTAFPNDSFYLPPEEVLRIESERERRGHFNVIHLESGYKADFYLAGEDPFHRWAFEHTKSVRILEFHVPVAPPEYVIIRKLQFHKEGGSEKHINDIKAIIRNSREAISAPELVHWAQLLGVEKELAQIRL